MTRVAQVGGSHYKGSVQHWDVVEWFRVGYLEATATKYIDRWDKKGTPVLDLEKAISYLERLLQDRKEVLNRVPGVVLDMWFAAREMSPEKVNLMTLILWNGDEQSLGAAIQQLKQMIVREQGE